ncbi:MAG: nuclear transport factor 2 family protein [Cytophagales bacterium]|nr:nuclear transport factor 2 family protein [Cytophagales bacterium]
MKIKSLLLVAIIGLSLNSYAQSPNLDESVEQLRQLLIEPTASGLKSITHFKLSYGHSSGKLENRDEFIEALISKKSDFTSIKLSNQTSSIIGKTAIVRHDLYAETLDGGKKGEVKLHILTVWLKQKKGWVLFARQAVK